MQWIFFTIECNCQTEIHCFQTQPAYIWRLSLKAMVTLPNIYAEDGNIFKNIFNIQSVVHCSSKLERNLNFLYKLPWSWYYWNVWFFLWWFSLPRVKILSSCLCLSQLLEPSFDHIFLFLLEFLWLVKACLLILTLKGSGVRK